MIGTTSIGLARDFLDALRKAPNLDIDFLEITCEYPHCYPETVDAQKRNEVKEFAARNSLLLTVHSTFSDINLVHINPGLRHESIRQTEGCIRFAQDIGASCVVIHPGEIPATARSLSQDILSNFGIEDVRGFFHVLSGNTLSAMKKDIALCVENMPEPYELCRTPEEHLSVVKDLSACFDVGHANIAYDAIVHAQKLKEKIFYVHIHDNHGVWDEHLSLGDGVAPWQEVIEILGERRYCFESQPFNEASAKKSISVLRQLTS